MTIRMTSARQSILEEIENSKKHLTINQIYERLKDRLPSLNISTVYRSLEYLSQKELISISDMGLGTPVYEILNDESHHHLVCLRCKAILDLDDSLISPFFKSIENKTNTKVLTNHLVVFGHCPNCKEE